MDATAARPDHKPEPHTGHLRFRMKERCQSVHALRSSAILRRGANESAGGACPAKLVAGRRDAANVLGVRAWWYKWTSDQREMHTLKWEHWVTFTHGLRLNGVARQCGRADTETNLRDRTAGDELQRDNELGCACLSKGAKCRFA